MDLNSLKITSSLSNQHSTQVIQEWLILWFHEKRGIALDECTRKLDMSYFEEGWLDSFAFISLILDIEENFKIKFSNDEFQNVNFSTLAGLKDIIERRIRDS